MFKLANLRNANIFGQMTKIQNLGKFYSTQLLSFNSSLNSLELVVKTKDNVEKSLKFKPMWLRFNCHEKTSFHEYTAQRIMDLDEVPEKLTIKNTTRKDENLLVEWNEISHKSILPIQHLIENHPTARVPRTKEKKFSLIKHLEEFDYNLLKEKNKPEMKRWIDHIRTYGICVVKNVPIEPLNCRKVAELIAPIQPNLYGDVFEIINTPKPINLALSNEKFMFHMDLPYLHLMPYIQFIQCLRFDETVKGGESLYLNGVHVAEQFRIKYPEEFKTLTEIQATFQRVHYERERPVHMTVKRKHIILNQQNEVEYVTWSPPNEGPLTNVTDCQIDRYYDSYLKFAKFINHHPDRMEFRMIPGDVVCFHNRKMLHSRNAFETHNGTRHFQGCYIDEDEFKSQAIVYELGII